MDNMKSILEALLFASGDAIAAQKLADIVEADVSSVRDAMDELINEYDYEKRGIKIIRLGDKYQLTTHSEYAEYIRKIVEPKRRNPLSKASLEVLAIVAYKQPVTRATIEHIRGVNCDNSVSRLLDLALIEECGRLDAPGRPALFATTDEFLRSFALSSLEDLPPLSDYVIEEVVNLNNVEETES